MDELNARVQAIRLQNGELGSDAARVPGRPYALHPGDYVQIRQTTESPGHGWVRNGTSGTVASVSPQTGRVALQLGTEREVSLTRDQLADADIRLAYVQHPFPAQGVTADAVHFIAGEQATAAGTYVGLTRARRQTSLYSSFEAMNLGDEHDPIERLAEIVGREERDAPSIDLNIDDTNISVARRTTRGWER